MPGDSPLVEGRQLHEVVRQIIADVLVVALEEVQPGKALVRDLGAESIDFMDLVFRLEDALGFRIPFPRWQRFIEETLQGQTPEGVREFQEETGAPLSAPNPQTSRMQQAVARAIISKRTSYARAAAKKGPKKGRTSLAPYPLPKSDVMMLEMALDERTPPQIQKLMFAVFNPHEQKMYGLKDMTFKYDKETKRFTLARAQPGERPAYESIASAYEIYKQRTQKIVRKKPVGTTAPTVAEGDRLARIEAARKAKIAEAERRVAERVAAGEAHRRRRV